MIFRIPIGDWGSDGHGNCSWFIASSDKSINEVREAHFNIKEKFNIDIHKIANEYEEPSVPRECAHKLEEIGIKMEDLFDYDDCGDIYIADDKGLANLWVMLLNLSDPELNIKILDNDEVPTLPFYGFDSKKRHISTVGYGVFY